MSEIAIKVENLSKCYQIYDKPQDRLLQMLARGHKHYFREFWALKDVSFEIEKGEAVGIIGRNGSGKSTLLQLICGTLATTGGNVKTCGRIAALLELGAGFNPEFSGRENVFMNGALLGMSRQEIESRFDDIAAFADIGEFIDQPIKTYSSGMAVRLAFSIQAQLEPDILIVDEALSVGDFFFQQKCFSFIRKLCENGVTLLFVSHDLGSLRDICKRAIYLKQGKLVHDGHSLDAISKYLGESYISDESVSERVKSVSAQSSALVDISTILKNALWKNDNQSTNEIGKLLAVEICNQNETAASVFRIGETVVIKIAYVSAFSSECHAAVTVLNKYNQVVTVMGSYFAKELIPFNEKSTSGNKIVICELRIVLQLEAGQYSLEVSTGRTEGINRGSILGQTPPLGPITITWDYENEIAPFLGQVGLPVKCKCYLTRS